MKNNNLVINIGKTADGKEVFADFYNTAQLLIGGQAGSGKSNFIHYLINSLMQKFEPEEMKFILANPKKAEFAVYKDSFHLLIGRTIVETKWMFNALAWLDQEIERRFKLVDEAGKMNIQAYNLKAKEKMPHIFFIIDEIADFMLKKETGKRKYIEEKIIKIAQIGRAVGIHMVIATSHINAKVLPGMWIANITSRLVFKTTTNRESRWMLDCSGAEQLNGNGEALFLTHEHRNPIRLQTPLNK